jgi:hypothetical protein
MSSAIVEKLQLELKDTIDGLGCGEVVAASSRNGDIRVLFRIHDEELWLTILSQYLSDEGDWYSFVGKKYMWSSGRLAYGWVMVLESPNLDKTVTDVRKILLDAAHSAKASLRRTRPGLTTSVEAVLDDGKMPGEIVVDLPSTSGYERRHQSRVRKLR